MNAFGKFLTLAGIAPHRLNAVGETFLGPGVVFNSQFIGAWIDPNFIEGYRFNADDMNWYGVTPGANDFDAASRASVERQDELDDFRYWRELHNRLESVPMQDHKSACSHSPSFLAFKNGGGWQTPHRRGLRPTSNPLRSGDIFFTDILPRLLSLLDRPDHLPGTDSFSDLNLLDPDMLDPGMFDLDESDGLDNDD